ncbi:peptidyl-prolyl cis-trans isomerase cyp15 [Pyricularia oryzae Y34]|uniref:Peptidyl-prolyl cis-trans isomerase-like 1 n=1 Tax=Pyricularia oryzae (strain Y34) TaxID=1143189 RepID=A0AA97PKC3_PYRO3|nr:peptidyl-prolyl cis-trans isomerase cyp15 [Pyricularia oryzae Y34]
MCSRYMAVFGVYLAFKSTTAKRKMARSRKWGRSVRCDALPINTIANFWRSNAWNFILACLDYNKQKKMKSEGTDDDVKSLKRSHSETQDDDDNSSDDDMGPQLPSQAPKKKRRVLPYEKLYTSALPKSPRYSKSLMHKEQLAFVLWTPITEFLITVSIDGVVKFWKKIGEGIEFVKEFKAHRGDQLDYVPRCVCWVHKKGARLPLLAVSEFEKPLIHILDGRGEKTESIHTIKGLHRSPVTLMIFNDAYDCVISADQGGMLEYWRPNETYQKPGNVFAMKSSTNLFEFKKAKAVPTSLTISPNGERTYDESIRTVEEMQQAGTAIQKLDDNEFKRRLAQERELDAPALSDKINVIFDESGHFIMYGSILGVKVLNTYSNKVVKVYGKDENFRALNLAIYQGQPQKKGVTTVAMAASSNPLLQESEVRDPILVATGAGKGRFYMFTNDEDISKTTRDVQNEKPTILGGAKKAAEKKAETGTSAIIHTSYGDIHIRMFPDAAPKAVENFVTHSKRGYYNNTIFHRVIRKFMIQCGDPLGDGTGGESIWGREFEDEFSSLKHDKPYTVSMANAGPNTNGSQFFITTEKTSWLDGKHTIFGRAVQGFDVIHKIENARTHKEKPEEDIKILNIDVF